MDLYDRITDLLKSKKITRRKLADDTGLSYNTLTTLYQRKSDMSGRMLKTIADYLNVTVEFLITGNDMAPSVNNGIIGHANTNNTITVTNGETHTRELSEIETELLRICAKLDIRKKVELLKFASDLENAK